MEKAIKKWDWKSWALVGLGGAVVIAGAAFVSQAKHASLGRQVHRNVTKFLIDNGARIDEGVISGGMVSIPMKTSIAVNSTVVSLLNMFTDQSGGRPPVNPSMTMAAEDRAAPPSRRQEERDARGEPASAPPAVRPGPRGRGGRGPPANARAPSDSPDDGDFKSREGKKCQDTTYNPLEFAPQGGKPPENVDLFADDH